MFAKISLKINCLIEIFINYQGWHKICFRCGNCERWLDSTSHCDGPDGSVYCTGTPHAVLFFSMLFYSFLSMHFVASSYNVSMYILIITCLASTLCGKKNILWASKY